MHIRSYHDYDHNHHSMIREHDMMLCLAELGIVQNVTNYPPSLKLAARKGCFFEVFRSRLKQPVVLADEQIAGLDVTMDHLGYTTNLLAEHLMNPNDSFCSTVPCSSMFYTQYSGSQHFQIDSGIDREHLLRPLRHANANKPSHESSARTSNVGGHR